MQSADITEVRAWAWQYGAAGLHPIELAGVSTQCKSPGKQPRNTGWTTEERPQHPDTYHPGCNLGLRMGRQSDGSTLVCVDVDSTDPGALAAIAPLTEWPITLIQRTGKDRWHFLYLWPAEVPLPGNKVKLHGPDGQQIPIDIRADGGQIVVQPSVHPETGRPYTWLNLGTDVKTLPIELAQAILKAGKQSRTQHTSPATETPGSVSSSSNRAIHSYPPDVDSVPGVSVLGSVPLFVEVSDAVWRRTLKKLASRNNPTAAAFERLGRGGALAEAGERDAKITAMCWALARELPQANPDWIARQFESSLSLMASLAPFAAQCDVALKFRTAAAKQAAEVPEVALLTSSQGGVIASIENVLRVLRGDQLLYCRFAYDEFAEKVVINSRLPWDGAGLHYPRHINDQDFSQLAAYFMRAHRLNVSTSMALEGVWVAARESAFHPVREYILGAVPKWDGKPRIDTWLIDFCGAEDCQVNRWIGSWWLMSAVRRIADPGCKNDYCLILEGRQGRKKSQALEALASREWFTDDVPNIQDTVAAAQNIAGKWIVELAELSCVRSAKDVEAVKGFLTRQIDRYRVPYGRVSEDHPRQSVFAGSVNDSEYLTDPTGNRRFWAVRVSDKNVDVEGLREIRDQLWAEAAVRMAAGEKHWPETEAQKALFERSIAKRQVSDSWSDKILCWLDNPIGYRGQPLTTAFVLEQVFDIRAARRGDDARVSACLQTLGWRRDVSGTLRVWVPPRALVSQPTNVIPLRSVGA